MLARYRIIRGRRPPDDPLPEGTRLDVRKHTAHPLRPESSMVEALLEDATDPNKQRAFAEAYEALLRRRYVQDPAPFEKLAAAARTGPVFIGCSCPTKRQPDVQHCHTVLALRFMQERFPDLDVRFP